MSKGDSSAASHAAGVVVWWRAHFGRYQLTYVVMSDHLPTYAHRDLVPLPVRNVHDARAGMFRLPLQGSMVV